MIERDVRNFLIKNESNYNLPGLTSKFSTCFEKPNSSNESEGVSGAMPSLDFVD